VDERVTIALHASTASELKQRIEAERRGSPFLVLRDAHGRQVLRELEPGPERVTVGRREDCHVVLAWDPEVSRLHAQLERIGGEWTLLDEGLSRNGSYVNGRQLNGRRRLRDGDRLCFGGTPVVFRNPAEAESKSTEVGRPPSAAVHLSPAQRGVLVALCRPVAESAFEAPASNQEIAAEMHLSVDAVKAHLRVLFARFGLEELPQNKKRARLAATALVSGVVEPHDL
jgi:FHA domain